MITGLIIVSEDLASITVGILAFDNRGGDIQRVIPNFEATADGLTLGEMGESFLTRGAFDGGGLQIADAGELPADDPGKPTSPIEFASLVKTGEAPFPLLDPLAPVRLEIWYGQEQVPVELRDGRAYVPEPMEHQDVRFVLSHTGPKDETYGVALKVNGENTLYRQRRPAIDCSKWIMYPDSAPTVIRGFQESQGKMRPFRVLSLAESQQNEFRYGRDTGQISFTVFRKSSEPIHPPILIDQEAEDLLAMMRGVYPPQPAENLPALKHQLALAARGLQPGQAELTRGLIVQSESTEEHATRIVDFQPDPTPVMSATITYYAPQD
jgi:hypothetical protein